MSDLRYPIGEFVWKGSITAFEREHCIQTIAETPARLRLAVAGLSDQQLDTPYRDGGWTVRQVVHHLPDSHINAYVRTKLTLTEDQPLVKTYEEAKWAELADSKRPIEPSLLLLDNLHLRWVELLRSLKPEDFMRTFRHPQHNGLVPFDWLMAVYSWHGPHHVAHITELRKRMGW
jgi:hypothetical protein